MFNSFHIHEYLSIVLKYKYEYFIWFWFISVLSIVTFPWPSILFDQASYYRIISSYNVKHLEVGRYTEVGHEYNTGRQQQKYYYSMKSNN